jgi:hypothetical protein
MEKTMISLMELVDPALRHYKVLDADDRRRNQQQAEVLRDFQHSQGRMITFAPTLDQLLRASVVIARRKQRLSGGGQ